MDKNFRDLDIKKELKTEAIFFLVLFVIMGAIFFITRFNMSKAQHKIDKFETLAIGNTYSGFDSIMIDMASERYIITFIDNEMLNYLRTDSNYYLDNDNKFKFKPNTIYEEMTVPYEFRATPMGKIVLAFENHTYYIRVNADGDIYIDFRSEPFSEQVDMVLKEVFRFINALKRMIF